MLTSVSEQFKLNEGRLKFTKELPQNNITQFLVVSLLLQEYHVRWQFSPTSSQPLLHFSSKQSVTLLIEVAMPCPKSCVQKMSTSFDVQVKWLLAYPHVAVATVAECLNKSILSSPSMVAESSGNKHVIGILYMHCLSQRLKKAGMALTLFLWLPTCAAMQRKNEHAIEKRCTDICFVKHKQICRLAYCCGIWNSF